jgi:hypothetical protein
MKRTIEKATADGSCSILSERNGRRESDKISMKDQDLEESRGETEGKQRTKQWESRKDERING